MPFCKRKFRIVSPIFMRRSHCIVTRVVPVGKRKFMPAANSLHSFSNGKEQASRPSGEHVFLKRQRTFYDFSMLAKKLTILFQASAASFGRYPSLLLGF